MDTGAEIKKALREALGINPNLAITATVVSVQENTCSIKLVSDLVLTDVRLCATISDEPDMMVIKPKVGSEVIAMSQTGKLDGLFIVKVDAVDNITFKKEDFEIIIDGQTKKVTIKNSTANLGALMDNLIDTIVSAQILTPQGPGTISPATQTQLTNIKTMFNALLNNV
ncbi:hypothetical protein [Flavobacterium sp.]|uniref:hypothetical protein n=1 Tax=Flavobacterium sp. TaxID=239 RepID=UPI004047FF22